MRRALHHGLERPRDAAGAATTAGRTHRRRRFQRLPVALAPARDLRHHGDGLLLLPRARQHPARGNRPAVFCRHRPACTKLLRRAAVAARGPPRRARRPAGSAPRVALNTLPPALLSYLSWRATACPRPPL